MQIKKKSRSFESAKNRLSELSHFKSLKISVYEKDGQKFKIEQNGMDYLLENLKSVGC